LCISTLLFLRECSNNKIANKIRKCSLRGAINVTFSRFRSLCPSLTPSLSPPLLPSLTPSLPVSLPCSFKLTYTYTNTHTQTHTHTQLYSDWQLHHDVYRSQHVQRCQVTYKQSYRISPCANTCTQVYTSCLNK